jgi:outer membrane protein TolC
VEALKSVLEQTQARYRAGLGTLLEVADAQRQLTQAEIDASLARLSVWRAELAVAHIQGDLEPFLARLP